MRLLQLVLGVGLIMLAGALSITKVTAQPVHLGCFADNRSAHNFGTPGRALADYCTTSALSYVSQGNCAASAPMTVELCIATCRGRGLAFAGVQYTDWCFCSNAAPNTEASGRCTMACRGNSSQICGGYWANNVYRTAEPEPPRPPDDKTVCGVSLNAPSKKLCVGTDEQCACVNVSNTCPYPVTVRFRISGRKDIPSISLAEAGRPDAVGSMCATGNAAQVVQYFGWRPWAGYPKKGQPRPRQ